jgi:hypothetical protein
VTGYREAASTGGFGTTTPIDIARDSGGNPFLVEALTRHVALGAEVRSTITLEEMVIRRLDALPREARAFLETLAICGRPVLPARIFEACGLQGDERRLVARLRSEHLLRSSRDAERVRCITTRFAKHSPRVPSATARRTHDLMAQSCWLTATTIRALSSTIGRPAAWSSRPHRQPWQPEASGVLAFDCGDLHRHAIAAARCRPRAQWAPICQDTR